MYLSYWESTKSRRPSWDEYFLLGTQWASLRGDCTRSQVGALLVEKKTHRILSHGYNGVAPKELGCLEGGCPRGLLSYEEHPPGGDYSNCKAKHAEWNCLDWAIHRHHLTIETFRNSVMYVSRRPCTLCEAYLRTEGVATTIWPDGVLDLQLPKM